MFKYFKGRKSVISAFRACFQGHQIFWDLRFLYKSSEVQLLRHSVFSTCKKKKKNPVQLLEHWRARHRHVSHTNQSKSSNGSALNNGGGGTEPCCF